MKQAVGRYTKPEHLVRNINLLGVIFTKYYQGLQWEITKP